MVKARRGSWVKSSKQETSQSSGGGSRLQKGKSQDPMKQKTSISWKMDDLNALKSRKKELVGLVEREKISISNLHSQRKELKLNIAKTIQRLSMESNQLEKCENKFRKDKQRLGKLEAEYINEKNDIKESFLEVRARIRKLLIDKKVSVDEKLKVIKENEQQYKEILKYQKFIEAQKQQMIHKINQIQKRKVSQELIFKDWTLNQLMECMIQHRNDLMPQKHEISQLISKKDDFRKIKSKRSRSISRDGQSKRKLRGAYNLNSKSQSVSNLSIRSNQRKKKKKVFTKNKEEKQQELFKNRGLKVAKSTHDTRNMSSGDSFGK